MAEGEGVSISWTDTLFMVGIALAVTVAVLAISNRLRNKVAPTRSEQ